MARRMVVAAALLFTLGAAMRAWAGDVEDCGDGETLVETEPAKVVAACRHLAEQGDYMAQTNFGTMYANGQGVPRDYAEAMKWFRKAADRSFDVAQDNIGSMYANGLGVPQDYAEAMRWISKAANQGYDVAQLHLGNLYYYGNGVPQDYVQAYIWWTLAAAQGNADAAKNRDIAASHITQAQIEQAKTLAATWKLTTGP